MEKTALSISSYGDSEQSIGDLKKKKKATKIDEKY